MALSKILHLPQTRGDMSNNHRYRAGWSARVMRLLKTALATGWRSGLLLGGVWVTYNLVHNLGHLDATGSRRLNRSLLVALVGLYGWAGWRGARATGRVTTGTLTAIGASLVSSFIAISALWIVTYVFLDTIRHNPFMIEDYRRSGMQDLDAFIIDDNLVPTFVGPWLSLALGGAVGTLGGVLGTWRWRID